MTQTIDWNRRALASEIALSEANGGHAVHYKNFIHIYNPHVPWGGDFNRAVGVKITDFESFEKVIKKVQDIHTSEGLEKPDRFDIAPPTLDSAVWSPYLEERGYSMHEVIFFSSLVSNTHLAPGFELYSPTENEYIQWYRELISAYDFFNDEYYSQLKPLHLGFVEVFRSYRLLKDKEHVGWVYCANLGDYCRLFSVEIKECFQGRGYGRVLLDGIKGKAFDLGVKNILLQTQENLRGFYEKCGFTECSGNSVIRLKQS
ncbi:GNAT family N-acetyltransferase [candidate division WOR-3 bacterium]|nr:GNAT family N-acetyltransferase [candidate division WOR-3 bacterium]